VKFYPGLNRDLIIAGLFLHDIAKTWELNSRLASGTPMAGSSSAHRQVGDLGRAEGEDRRRGAGRKIPQPLINVLQHIILSHHEKPEFGAARVPSTPEALFVSMIDNMDAKMMIVLQACRGESAERRTRPRATGLNG